MAAGVRSPCPWRQCPRPVAQARGSLPRARRALPDGWLARRSECAHGDRGVRECEQRESARVRRYDRRRLQAEKAPSSRNERTESACDYAAMREGHYSCLGAGGRSARTHIPPVAADGAGPARGQQTPHFGRRADGRSSPQLRRQPMWLISQRGQLAGAACSAAAAVRGAHLGVRLVRHRHRADRPLARRSYTGHVTDRHDACAIGTAFCVAMRGR
jgi:hypothetical protein